jgi:hypothetical protein
MFALQPSQTTGKSVTAQQVGQAVSYAVKNVEFKLFALTGDPEPDSDESNTDPERNQEADSALMDLAKGMLARFEQAPTLEAIDAVNESFRKEWARLKHIPGLSEAIVAQRTSAQKRVRG